MSVVISRTLVLGRAADDDPDLPLLGWRNLVTVSNIAANTEATGLPATNLANPATHLLWRGSDTTKQYLTVETGSADDIDYVGIARHNFGSEAIAIAVDGASAVDAYSKIHLHFDGADASTTCTDDNTGGSAHTWTANGNAQLDTADKKFGTASALFDGTGDYFTTPDHADFTLGSGAWTLEAWFKVNAAGGTILYLCGQADSANTATARSIDLQRTVGNLIRGSACVGSTVYTVTSTSQYTNALNTGWHHVMLVRTGNILRLFIDGVQAGTDTAITGAINNSPNAWSVGRNGEITTTPWNGWLDEFRLSVGVARQMSAFIVEDQAYDQWGWAELVEESVPADDGPLLLQFVAQPLVAVRLRMATGDAAPEAAVMYVGKLLQMARKLYQGHSPIKHARKTKAVNGRSESGNFLGRIVTTEWNESSAAFSLLTPEWYRSDLDAFLAEGKDLPFFFAWRPSSYPAEVGYAFLTNDPTPVNASPHGLIAIELAMSGVV